MLCANLVEDARLTGGDHEAADRRFRGRSASVGADVHLRVRRSLNNGAAYQGSGGICAKWRCQRLFCEPYSKPQIDKRMVLRFIQIVAVAQKTMMNWFCPGCLVLTHLKEHIALLMVGPPQNFKRACQVEQHEPGRKHYIHRYSSHRNPPSFAQPPTTRASNQATGSATAPARASSRRTIAGKTALQHELDPCLDLLRLHWLPFLTFIEKVSIASVP